MEGFQRKGIKAKNRGPMGAEWKVAMVERCMERIRKGRAQAKAKARRKMWAEEGELVPGSAPALFAGPEDSSLSGDVEWSEAEEVLRAEWSAAMGEGWGGRGGAQETGRRRRGDDEDEDERDLPWASRRGDELTEVEMVPFFSDSDEGEEYLLAMQVLEEARAGPPGAPANDEEFLDVLALLYEELEADVVNSILHPEELLAEEVLEEEKAVLATPDSVVCPVCVSAPLEVAKSVIFCRCGEVRVHLKHQAHFSLVEIADTLAQVGAAHGSVCSAPPSFKVMRMDLSGPVPRVCPRSSASSAGEDFLVLSCIVCDAFDIVF